MEEIARAAEMSKKTLYQFFSDKEAVFSELLQSEDMPEFRKLRPMPTIRHPPCCCVIP